MAYQPAPTNFQQQRQQGHPTGQDEVVQPPPLSSMKGVQGYENVQFKSGEIS